MIPRAVVAAAVLGALAIAAPAAAQTTTPTTVTGATTAPAPTAPPATVPQVTAAPATVPGATTTSLTPGTTVESSCTSFPAVSVVFVGTAVAKSDVAIAYRVTEVREGTIPSERIEVGYPDDARFLRIGRSYLVAAAEDPESGQFSSKVRRPPGEDLSEACVARDRVITLDADGSPIDTAIFAGMRGKWNRALFLILAPLAAAILVLAAVALLKNLAVVGFKAPGRVRDARARRRPPPPAPEAPADEPQSASRR